MNALLEVLLSIFFCSSVASGTQYETLVLMNLHADVVTKFDQELGDIIAKWGILKLAQGDGDRLSPQEMHIIEKKVEQYEDRYNKEYENLNDKRRQLIDFFSDGKFRGLFSKVYKFYRPQHKEPFPLITYIVMELEKPFYERTTLFIAAADRPFPVFAREIIRHWCEILYDYMANQMILVVNFLEHPSDVAILAFNVLKKVLADCISYITIRNMGENYVLSDKKSSLEFISESIFSFVIEYLNKGGHIDRDFVVRYIDVFAESYSTLGFPLDLILGNKLVIKTNSEEFTKQVFDVFQKKLASTSFTTEDDFLSPVVTVNVPGKDTGKKKVEVSFKSRRIFVSIWAKDIGKIAQAVEILKTSKISKDGFSKEL